MCQGLPKDPGGLAYCLMMSGEKGRIILAYFRSFVGLTVDCPGPSLGAMQSSAASAAPEQASLPLHRQIAAELRADIESGRLSPGARLLPIRALAAQRGVNRDTVAAAYEELGRAGLVESTVGRGTFVRAAPEPSPSAEPPLSPVVDRLLEFQGARPTFRAVSDAVPLHALVPDPALYPVEDFRRALRRVLARDGAELLRYATPQGHEGLREVLAARCAARGLDVGPEGIVLSQGASEGISLAFRVFTAPGDAVAVEEPTYHNVLATLLSLGLRPAPVPMLGGGIELGALERTLQRPEVKALYTIPAHHNPMGVSSNEAHRRELLRLAARAGKPVIEDAYQADLRFAGRSVPSLAALDRTGLVVQLTSLSKSLFPGGRVGALLARGRVVPGLLALKQAADLGGSLLLQAGMAEFVRSGAYDRHLGRLRRTLRSRHAALQEALAAELPRGSAWTRPDGGYPVWVELPEEIDTRELLADAAREGVLFAPGAQFHHDGRRSSALRLTVAMADETGIRRGVAALGRVARARLAAGPGRGAAASVFV